MLKTGALKYEVRSGTEQSFEEKIEKLYRFRKNRPNAEELRDTINNNRLKNGRVNLTKVAENYGVHRDTIKSMIIEYNLQDFSNLS